MISRRGFLGRAAAFIAAPAIVRASSLMGVRPLPPLVISEELPAITRAAFLPRMVAQIYQNTAANPAAYGLMPPYGAGLFATARDAA